MELFNGTVVDASGNGFNGVMYNSPTPVFRSLLFNGSNQYVEFLDLLQTLFTGPYAICIVFKIVYDSSDRMIYFGQDVLNTHYSYTNLRKDPSNQLQFELRYNDNVSYVTFSCAVTEGWHRVVLSVGNNVRFCYLDGTLIYSDTTTSTYAASPSGIFSIGRMYQSWVPYAVYNYNSEIGPFMIFRRALTHGEAMLLQNFTQHYLAA